MVIGENSLWKICRVVIAPLRRVLEIRVEIAGRSHADVQQR